MQTFGTGHGRKLTCPGASSYPPAASRRPRRWPVVTVASWQCLRMPVSAFRKGPPSRRIPVSRAYLTGGSRTRLCDGSGPPTCCRRPPVTRPPRSIGKKPAAPNSPATAALAAASSPDRKITRRPPASFGSAPSTLATSVPPVAYTAMTLAAWQGQETPAAELIEATAREAAASGQGRLVDFAAYASAVLYNGLGRHDAARDAAWRAFERDQLGYGPLVVPELAEAASRTGDVAAVRAALNWLSERAQVTPTDWAL